MVGIVCYSYLIIINIHVSDVGIYNMVGTHQSRGNVKIIFLTPYNNPYHSFILHIMNFITYPSKDKK